MCGNENMPAIRLPENFAGTVLIRRGTNVCYQVSRGYSDRSDYVPNAPDTRFSMASVGKVFTAVTLLQLVEEGWIGLEDSLSEVLPEGVLAGFPDGVTVGRLLSHTSGIPDYFDESVMKDYAELWNNRPVHRMRRPTDFLPLFQDLPMQFEPGTAFCYNNAAFVVLALIIENVTGKPFTEVVQARVFDKAGMADSGYYMNDRLPSRCARGYRKIGVDWVSNIFDIPPVGNGDGGAWSTGMDMLRFWDALSSHVLLGPTLTSRMLQRQWRDEEETGYGFGVWLKNMGKHDAWYLQGCDPGVSATSLFDPVRNVAYVILSNTEFGAWELDMELTRLIRMDEL